jgi:hypothetical protein
MNDSWATTRTPTLEAITNVAAEHARMALRLRSRTRESALPWHHTIQSCYTKQVLFLCPPTLRHCSLIVNPTKRYAALLQPVRSPRLGAVSPVYSHMYPSPWPPMFDIMLRTLALAACET